MVLLEAPGVYNNPPAVGPGTFERKDSALGPQHLSKRRNQSTYAFAKGPKFGRNSSSDDVISKYDAARSCFGKQVLQKNRSAPSVGFNHDTRDMRNKTKLCMTRLDEGPKAVAQLFSREVTLVSGSWGLQNGSKCYKIL